ncbi:MAG: hypothetical protein EZS28_016713 [Streblomastix strix]|uniref:Uncharacterized protein n=1 Tax=Streblomastix strix TaxID=222440 RepID=A0A5J4VYW6_9EUKA|nr:MAG: hypothetical protein EZS28_016713 [Streblomastix strix]
MSFSSSDYLKRLAAAQHSDYINTYSQFQEVMQTQTIIAQSFSISKQQFFDQPVTQLTNDGAHYTRAPLAARGTATCTMVQTCQISWQIQIPANTLAIQVNGTAEDGTLVNNVRYRQITNYNAINTGVWQTDQLVTMESGATGATQQPYNTDEHIKFWLGFSIACGPFNQIAICKDSQKLWDTSIYAREQAIISSNSLTDQCTSNSVTVSPLESIVQGKRHCGIFIDIPVNAISVAGAYNYLIPYDIVFSGVMDLNQLNPIFNSFPVLTRNYAQLYIQLWMQDFIQDLKVVWLNKYNPVNNSYLAYAMIPPEKPDIIYLKNRAAAVAYDRYAIRLVNMEGKPNTTTIPTATISQIKNAKFTELYINNLCINIENEAVIGDMIRTTRIINFPTQVLRTQSSNYPASNIGDGGGFIQTIMSFSNIKSLFVTFAMPQYPTWFFPLLFKNIDLIIDQRHVISSSYPALTQDVCGQMFDCFVDQDVVSASSDLYHSLVFENQHIDDMNYPYEIEADETTGQLKHVSNVFYETTLYNGTKAIKTFYPNKYMLAWKLATDGSFMRGYNSSKIGARTNIQVQLGITPVDNICTDNAIRLDDVDQNNFQYFTSTRCYPNIKNVKLTPLTHYLCDGVVRIMFDDNPEPQVLSLEVIGEISGSAIRSG